MVFRHDFLAHFNQVVFRYDRKDPTSVAVSISPEASLMLGESMVIQNCKSLMLGQSFPSDYELAHRQHIKVIREQKYASRNSGSANPYQRPKMLRCA